MFKKVLRMYDTSGEVSVAEIHVGTYFSNFVEWPHVVFQHFPGSATVTTSITSSIGSFENN